MKGHENVKAANFYPNPVHQSLQKAGGQKTFLPYFRSETPFPGISVPFHDDPLDLGHDAVIASGDDRSGHKRDGQTDGFPFGRHQHDLLVQLNPIFISGKSRTVGRKR